MVEIRLEESWLGGGRGGGHGVRGQGRKGTSGQGEVEGVCGVSFGGGTGDVGGGGTGSSEGR